jgi:hypothetical protein
MAILLTHRVLTTQNSQVIRKNRLTTARDTGRGGINPSFVFLQLYFGGMLNSGQELPILLPQSDVSFTNQRIETIRTTFVSVLFS